MTHARSLVSLGLLGAIAFSSACSPPQGRDGGRLTPTTTTYAEEKSAALPITSIVEASSKISEDVARDIVRVSGEVGKGFRVVVVFGDLENKTQGGVNTTDFELMRERLKSRLVQSSLFRDNVKFVANRAALASLNAREIGQAKDPLQEGGAAQTPALNPQYTLYLNGSMYGSFRGGTNYYYITFKLIRASDGEEVFNADYEIKRG